MTGLVPASGSAVSPGRRRVLQEEIIEEETELFPGHELKPLPDNQVSLVALLKERLHRIWKQEKLLPQDVLCEAVYDNNLYLRQRAPDEIEEVLATLDRKAMDHFEHSFGDDTMDLRNFAEAIVHTGTYDADRVHAFVGGVVDLYLEVRRSQRERAPEDEPLDLQWAQLMNHLIESPEVAMFEGNVAMGVGGEKRTNSANMPQANRANITDCAKHPGGNIDKIYWMPYLGDLITVEGTESLYFWSPEGTHIDAYKNTITPSLPPEFFDESGRALFTVMAMAWDSECQDITALLSNRMIIVWRLRSREKGQWQQRRELRVHAHKQPMPPSLDGGKKEPLWKYYLKLVDWKDSKGNTTSRSASRTSTTQGGNHAALLAQDRAQEMKMMREKREERQAAEVATMLDIWWNTNMKMYVTTDRRGRLFFWDLRQLEASILEGGFSPVHQLNEHKGRVTSIMELSKHKFTTCSLDHTVILWDNRNLTSPEMKIEEHSNAVLCQAYLPLFSSLVSVGCEKRVFVWSIDSTAYRGVRAKLSAHPANLRHVAAGNRVFFTLDEAFTCIVWDGATLANLQTINCATQLPKLTCVLPTLGKLCLGGRRLNFYEGNEQLAHLIGMVPTKEQLARRKAEEQAAGSLKERAKPRWCGISACRGSLISVTEAEVKVHGRESGRPRAVFNAPHGESISAYTAVESMSLAILATNKGAVHFLKYRSGFSIKHYPGRKVEEPVARAQPRQARRDGGGDGEAEGDARPRARSESGGGVADPVAGARPRSRSGGDSGGRSASPGAARGQGADIGGRSASPGAARGQGASPTAISAAGRAGAAAEEGSAVPPRGSPTSAEATAGAGESSSPSGGGAIVVAVAQEDEGREADVLQATRRSAAIPVIANAPTPEEIQRGLSSNVCCLLPCEERGRIFAGTAEGQVIVYALDGEDFPVIRWTNAGPEDGTPVTCLQYTTSHKMLETAPMDDESGLLIVGTQEGSAHLYGIINLRHAGSVKIPWILPDPEGSPDFSAIRHILMFTAKASIETPCTMLTVDDRSRMRLWGMRIHVFSGKLRELRLVLDGSQPMPLRLEPLEGIALGVCTREDLEKPDIVYIKKKKTPEQEQAEKAAMAKEEEEAKAAQSAAGSNANTKGSQGGEKDPKEPPRKKDIGLPYATRSKDARVTCLCVMEGRLALPTFERFRWTEEQGRRPPPLPPETADATAEEDGGISAGPFLTQPPVMKDGAGGKASTRTSSKDQKPEEDSDTDGEAPDRVEKKLKLRPRTPPLPREGEVAPFKYEDATHMVFIADAAGWIRCLDMAASVHKAIEDVQPVAVRIEDPATMEKPPGRKRLATTDRIARFGSSSPPTGTTSDRLGVRAEDNHSPLLCGPAPTPRPEVWTVIGAWRASEEAVLSLVPTTMPLGLVTVDVAKEVKIWSTSGELWGHLSLLPKDGVASPVSLWPPPQTLAAQLALMEVAKGLTEKLGLNTKRKRVTTLKPQSPTQPSRSSPSGRQRGAAPGASPQGRAFASRQSPTSASVDKARDRAEIEATTVGGETQAPAEDDPTARSRGDTQLSNATVFTGSSAVGALGAAADQEDRSENVPDAEAAAVTKGASDSSTAAVAPKVEEGAEEPDGEGSPSASALAQETAPRAGDASSTPSRPMFSRAQLSEMIRNNAFSSGFKSYKQFKSSSDVKLPARTSERRPMPTRGQPTQQELHERRRDFFSREAEAFGVELATKADKQHWELGTRSLGPRSASEGALVRFADHAVNDVTQRVREDLRVDVARTTRQQIRRPTFLARLDIGRREENIPGVSPDPTQPSSATAQAVQRITCPQRPGSAAALSAILTQGGSSDSSRQRSSLQNAGMMAVSKSRG